MRAVRRLSTTSTAVYDWTSYNGLTLLAAAVVFLWGFWGGRATEDGYGSASTVTLKERDFKMCVFFLN